VSTTYQLSSAGADKPVSVLSERQKARVEALKAAREVLAARNVLSSGPADALDLVNVAMYIETGEDPWPSGLPLAVGGDDE
jgi:hypothetical protein